MLATHEAPMFGRKLGTSAGRMRRSLAFATAVLSLALTVAQPASLAQHLLHRASKGIDIAVGVTPSTEERCQEQARKEASLRQKFLSSGIVHALTVL